MTNTIKFEDVFQSYNGKSGCMCGCRGSYKLPSADLIADANEDSGWEAFSEENVSPRAVKLAVNKINKALADGDENAAIVYGLDGQPEMAYLDDNSRNTVVYLKTYIARQLEASRARKAQR